MCSFCVWGSLAIFLSIFGSLGLLKIGHAQCKVLSHVPLWGPKINEIFFFTKKKQRTILKKSGKICNQFGMVNIFEQGQHVVQVIQVRLEVITQQKINGQSMFQNKLNLEGAAPKIVKSAFTQLTLLDPALRTEHKMTRESSCDSQFQQSSDLAKNYVDLQNQSWSGQLEADANMITRPKGCDFNYSSGGQNKKRTSPKFVDTLHDDQRQEEGVLNTSPIIKGSWTKEQDDLLIALVAESGAKNWSAIAKKLKGRMGKQCRERWHNHLNPDINKKKWTEEEDQKIIEYHQKFGNKWALISKYLPGRTDNAIKNHWNSTISRKLAQEKLQKNYTGKEKQFDYFLTPRKPKQQNQWNTANSYLHFQTPKDPSRKNLEFFGSVSLNQFTKKKAELELKRDNQLKPNEVKLGLVFPLFASVENSSGFLLQRITQILEQESHEQ